MNFFDWVNNLFTSKGLERTVSALHDNQPVYPGDNYADLAVGGFSKNEVVFACINEIVTSLSEAPIKVRDNLGEVIEVHPTLDLFKRPNPHLSQYDFWEITLIHLYLAGNAFWYKVRNGSGKVIELWPLMPHRVKIVPSSDKYIGRFEYEVDGKKFPIEPVDIVHHKFPDPTSDFLGMSPLRAGLRRVAVDNDLTDLTKSTLENGGMPMGILKTTDTLNEHIVRRMRSQWRQNFGGKKRGELAILDGDMSFEPISMDMNALAMPDLTSINEARICMLFGVPPILIGAKVGLDRSTYANYKEARLSFWEETISGLQRRLLAKIETDPDLAPNDIEFFFDDSDVPALADRRQKKLDNAILGFNSGLLTHDEARAEVGLPPIEDNATEGPQTPPEATQDPNEEQELRDMAKSLQTEAKIEELAEEKADRRLRLLRQSLGSLKAADEYFDRFRHWAKKEFKRQGLQLLAAVEEFLEGQIEQRSIGGLETKADEIPLDPTERDKLLGKLAELEPIWTKHSQDTIAPHMNGLMEQAGALASARLRTKFDIRDEFVASFIDGQRYKFGASVTDSSASETRKAIATAFDNGETIGQLKNRLKNIYVGEGAEKRAERIARTETIRASNEGARAAYKHSGVTQMQWVASGDACPYCQGLDGAIVGVDDPFVKQGDTYQPEGAASPLNLNYGDIPSPPCHPGCRCTIIPLSE